MTTSSVGGDSSSGGEQYLGDSGGHQPRPSGGTTEESVEMSKGGTKEEREQGYESRLIELMKTEGPMGMWSEYPSECQTQLCYVSTESSAQTLLILVMTYVWNPHHI